MKIDDIIRIALNKTIQEHSQSSYAKSFFWRKVSRERLLHYLKTSVAYEFWMQVHRIAVKRRPWKKDVIPPTLDDLLIQLSKYPVEIDQLVADNEERAYVVRFSNMAIMLTETHADTQLLLWSAHGGGERRIGGVLRDMVEIMVKVNEALNDLPSLVKKVYQASHTNLKSEEILLASAQVLINEMNIPPEIHIITGVDKKGLINTSVSKGGYQKRCKSTLDTLQANILKTITLVTHYRFTGYVEEV